MRDPPARLENEGPWQSFDRVQDAVEAVFYLQFGIAGLEMDVTGAAAYRICDHAVDQPHHGRVGDLQREFVLVDQLLIFVLLYEGLEDHCRD